MNLNISGIEEDGPVDLADLARAVNDDAASPTRPLLVESSVYRADQKQRLQDAKSEIDMIDESERKAERDLERKIKYLRDERSTTHTAQTHRREDLQQIVEGTTAALAVFRSPDQKEETADV